MKQAANAFQSSNFPARIAPLIGGPLPPALISVARSFVHLQDERHSADYDLADQFDRNRVQELIREAEGVFRDWNAVRNSDEAKVFLAALMFWSLWSK